MTGSLMVDVRGLTLDDEERAFLMHPAVGGVILFARNYQDPDQLLALTSQIKTLREHLLIAVDQEGGKVQRFREHFTPLPTAARLGELYDRDRVGGLGATEVAGYVMAVDVLSSGVDFSFAPVLDLQNPNSAVIGRRAFHSDPHAVCELAGAYIAGMNRVGMSAVGKHFPGHGAVAEDSHYELPRDPRTFAEMKNDLSPFEKLAPKLKGMMTAHIKFTAVADELPAYSKFWLGEVLRDRMKFTGMIFSDDLTMKGAGDGDVAARSVAALNAGCDMVLICNDPDGARHAAEVLGDGHPCRREAVLKMLPILADLSEAELKHMKNLWKATLAAFT